MRKKRAAFLAKESTFSDGGHSMPSSSTGGLSFSGAKESTGKVPLPLLMPPPIVSAQSWVVFDTYRTTILYGKDENEKRQMASLTKIMTALVTCNTLDDLGLDSRRTFLTVSREASLTQGTTAYLREGL